jgi:hypothetical protein
LRIGVERTENQLKSVQFQQNLNVIISHKYRFIFIKSVKTAGTSIEVFLSQICGPDDVITRIKPPHDLHVPRNFRGNFNPIPELLECGVAHPLRLLNHALLGKRYFSHLTARQARARTPRRIWNSYHRFCVERNPWDKTISHYYMKKFRSKRQLTLDEYFQRGSFCINAPRYTARDGRTIIVDEVLKYENLNADLQKTFDRLGIPFNGKLPKLAKTSYRDDRRSYREVLNDRQRDIIAKAFTTEIRMHGYQF